MVGNCLLDQGKRVGVDFEDWFSEDLLPEAQATRPVSWLKRLEAKLAQNCDYCLTTSQMMADAISEAYDCAKPTVVYNAFPVSDAVVEYHDRHNLDRVSLHWFSQTIGPGRGLEMLLQALQYINSKVEIHLRGNCPMVYQDWLTSLIPDSWNEYVFVHPTVDNDVFIGADCRT